MILTTRAEMRALDQWTIQHGTPGHVLMERAGVGAARVLRERFGKSRGPILVVCGKGNNGGDGFVLARTLRRARYTVEVWLLADPRTVEGDALRMLAAWRRGGGKLRDLTTSADLVGLRDQLPDAAVVVDALLGTGLSSPVAGIHADVISAINAAGRPTLAVDIASGLCADSGRPQGVAVRAAATATFGYAKIGQCVFPGAEYTGMLDVVDIGIPPEALVAVAPHARLLDATGVGRALPRRSREAHKGTTGHLLVIGGSRGKAGAALLAAEAGARAGAGLTTLAVPASVQSQLEGRVAEIMTVPLPEAADGSLAIPSEHALRALLDGRAAVVCGPGLGVTDATRALVASVLRYATAPVVLDADALTAVAGTSAVRDRTAPTVLTPHPGEMARLLQTTTAAVQNDRLAAARQLAASDGAIVVLKGARSVVATVAGEVSICPTGNPGMASGGMGDALAGILGALLAQGVAPADAAALAVYAHGLSADRVAERRGEVGLLARDVIDELPPTIAALQAASDGRS